MEGPRIFFTLPFFGGININETEINLTIVTLILLVLSLVLTHKMERSPAKRHRSSLKKLSSPSTTLSNRQWENGI